MYSSKTTVTSTSTEAPIEKTTKTILRRNQLVKTTVQPSRVNITTKGVKSAIEKPSKEQVFIVEAQKANDEQSPKNKDEFSHASTGEGVDDSKNSKKLESKKTLSDQVAEGKYGLIQNDLFKEKPKRPGIISYLPNSEFAEDTSDNYGGLSTDDIWLSENHLLVLKAGEFNNNSKNEPWKPIDDYVAPLRQVKIPSNPKVPPPFPVQLEENGPIHFIQSNQFPLINPFTNESLYLFPEDGFPKTDTYSKDKTNIFARPGTIDPSKVVKDHGYINPASNTTGLYDIKNFTFSNPFLSPEPLPPPEFYPPFPPFPIYTNGSLENGNINDTFDEDDPSFYYPPPYTFFYKSNYSNPVKPGPLVPGIILPPPPNFFSRAEKKRVTTVRPIETKLVRPVKIYEVSSNKNIITTTRKPTSTTIRPLTTSLKQVQVPKMIAFVPKEAILNDSWKKDKGKAIYYEYFDAGVKANVQSPYTPASGATIKTTLSAVQKQNVKSQLKPTLPYRNTYLPPLDYNKYVYITPKPDIRPNGAANENNQHSNIVNALTAQSFGKEVDNIRHQLHFYKPNEQQHPLSLSQLQQRNPKSKAVYEYSFNMTPLNLNPNDFTPPTEFDSTPFKPMVQYSLPLNTDDGFTAISTTTPPTLETTTVKTNQSPFTSIYTVLNAFQNSPQFYPTSQKPSIQYIPIETTVVKQNTLNNFDSYINAPQLDRPIQQINNPRKPIAQFQHAWPTAEEVRPNKINVQIQTYSPEPTRPYPASFSIYENDYSLTSTEKNKAYFYSQPPKYQPYFYQSPPQIPSSYVVPSRQLTAQENTYLRQIESLRQQIGNYPSQYHYEVTNDTVFNSHAVPRSPFKHNSKFIESYQIDQKRLPLLPHIFPPNYNNRQRQPPPPPNLHKDILVNYKYPLPPINPDSELLPPTLLQPLPLAPIAHTTVLPQTLQYNRYGRLKHNPTVVQYKLPGEQQASVYFYTPLEEKSTQIK